MDSCHVLLIVVSDLLSTISSGIFLSRNDVPIWNNYILEYVF
nr:MAG TPA: hypothetical protein [Caudoviricetes sp.]